MSRAGDLVPAGTKNRRGGPGSKGRLIVTVALTSGLGALGGAVFLLTMPAAGFAAAVPLLVLLAATLVGVQPLLSRWLRARAAHRVFAGGKPRRSSGGLSRALGVASTVIGGYGGYFGAGQGVMMVDFLALDEGLQVVNGLKNVAALSANVAASLVIVVAAPLDWSVVGLIALESVVGGWLGAHIGRRLPPAVFRILVVVFGYAVGIRLLVG